MVDRLPGHISFWLLPEPCSQFYCLGTKDSSLVSLTNCLISEAMPRFQKTLLGINGPNVPSRELSAFHWCKDGCMYSSSMPTLVLSLLNPVSFSFSHSCSSTFYLHHQIFLWKIHQSQSDLQVLLTEAASCTNIHTNTLTDHVAESHFQL